MSRILGFSQKQSLRGLLSYVGVQFTLTITSFVTIPFLARVLGPETWGVLVLAQAINAGLVILIEYGFTITGSRAVAQGNLSLRSGGGRVAGIYATRAVLSALAVLIGLLIYSLVPALHDQPVYLLLAVVWAVLAGFGPWWFFLARADLGRPAALAIGTRLIATAAIFVVVDGPSDGWLVLAAYGIASLLDSAVMTVWVVRDAGTGPAPRWSEIAALLVEGGPVFAQQAGGSLFGAAGTIVLGALALPVQVAYYGGGDKIQRLGRQLVNTVSRVVFPRMAAIQLADPERADRIRKQMLLWGALGAAVAAAVGGLLAPWAVMLLFGQGYEPVVPVLRILLVATPFMAITDIVGTQGLLARGNDRAFALIALSVSLTGLVISAVFASFFAHLGMAAGATLTEITLAGAMILAWRKL